MHVCCLCIHFAINERWRKGDARSLSNKSVNIWTMISCFISTALVDEIHSWGAKYDIWGKTCFYKPSVVVSECVTMVNDDGGRVDVSGDNLIGWERERQKREREKWLNWNFCRWASIRKSMCFATEDPSHVGPGFFNNLWIKFQRVTIFTSAYGQGEMDDW